MKVEILLTGQWTPNSVGTIDLPARPVKGDRIIFEDKRYIVRRIYITEELILVAAVKFSIILVLL